MIETDMLAMCACSETICSSAALSTNFLLSYEIMMGDLYANAQYRFRSRAVTYNYQTFQQRSQLAAHPLEHSDWTPWSQTFFTSAGSPPSQPPHPIVLTPRITSIEFRIVRAQWNGIPIAYYEFEMAPDQNCDSLNSLFWNVVKPVQIYVNSTFEPFVDFRRGGKR